MTKFKMSPYQIMCAMNLFSSILTSMPLINQGGFQHALDFMNQFPEFFRDCITMSICNTLGQVCIYKILELSGPVTFIINANIRRVISIVLSSYTYGHVISVTSGLGIFIVFFAVFLNIYLDNTKRNDLKTKGQEYFCSPIKLIGKPYRNAIFHIKLQQQYNNLNS